MRSDARRVVVTRLGVGLAALSVILLLVAGLAGNSGPDTVALAPRSSVVLISVPGLQWGDLAATETPAIDELLGGVALGSVRAIGPTTTLPEGYLTIGAGYRMDDVDDPGGAEPGALGTALRNAGRSTAVFGSEAALGALMDADGAVGHSGSSAEVDFAADVTLVELLGLEQTSPAAERAERLASIDVAIAAMQIPDDAAVLLVVPMAPDERAEVVVFAAQEASRDDGSLVRLSSATTRRSGYVTLPDVAPTVLGILGLDVPDSMNGTEIRAVSGSGADATAASTIDDLDDLSARIEFRDRAVGPVSVVFVALIVLCGVGALGRSARTARTLAPIVVAYPTVTFLAGATSYHRVPLDFFVVSIVAVAALVAAVTVASTSRWGRWAPVSTLCALLWAVLVVDVVIGGRLQINTAFGYTPTIAGRFQGIGNLAFGLLGAATLATAVVPLLRYGTDRADAPRPPLLWVPTAWVCAVTAITIAMPAFGSDVGGTLAFVPAAAVLIAAVAERRFGWRQLVIGGVATIVVVAGLALLDRSRPASSRTHLGRFADDVLSGDAGDVLARKLRGNISIMTASIWPAVLIALVIAGAVVAWRRREHVGALLRRLPAVDAFVRSFGVLAVLGMVLNDSGIAVPAAMLGVAVPWLVSVLMAPVVRAGRE